jgi:hypothetical protein
MGRTKPIVAKDYIVGLTDGEGCFYVNVWESSAYRSGYGVQLHFHIKMQERDHGLLRKIMNTLRCGAVYFQKEQRANHAQCYRYTVHAQRDIFSKIIPFFQQNQLESVSKRKSFAIFCQIAQLVQNKAHLTTEGIKQIRMLKKHMNQKTIGLA